jgi:hypothetical protein
MEFSSKTSLQGKSHERPAEIDSSPLLSPERSPGIQENRKIGQLMRSGAKRSSQQTDHCQQ